MAMDFQTLVQSVELPPGAIEERATTIYKSMLSESAYITTGNFTQFHASDLERLFDLYDASFFDGNCRQLVGDVPLQFRLSKRMTRAAGKTTVRRFRDRKKHPAHVEYEIAISSTLLFQTFQDEERAVSMSGIPCLDRLTALQRVMEHEMIHLIEFLLWHDSRCAAPRFQSISSRFFGHTEHQHQLITSRERALTKFGIRTGSRVSFRVDGEHREGVVNRITKRATVLVEDSDGLKYSDGKRYAKYYVPLPLLRPADK